MSIGVGIAFQTGIFNIGANGQAVLGGIIGTAAGSMIHMPTVVHIPFTLLAGIAGGVISGAVPGVLKALTGAHEVIVTIMFNYVLYAFLLFAVLSTALQQPGQQNDISRTLDPSAQLAPIFGAKSGLRVSWGVLVAVAVVFFAWWLLDRSSLGFEFRVTGANPQAARASGMNARIIVIVVFLISGGLAGLAGVVQVASTTHYIDGVFLIGNAGIGFTAITVALLGRNRPMGIVWSSLLSLIHIFSKTDYIKGETHGERSTPHYDARGRCIGSGHFNNKRGRHDGGGKFGRSGRHVQGVRRHRHRRHQRQVVQRFGVGRSASRRQAGFEHCSLVSLVDLVG